MAEQLGQRKRRFSVGAKLSAATATLVAAALAFAYIGATRFLHARLLSARESEARMIAQLFAQTVSAPVVFDDPIALEETIRFLRGNEGVVAIDVWRPSGSGPIRLGSWRRFEDEPGPALVASESARVETGPSRMTVVHPVRDTIGSAIAIATIQFSLERENAAFAAASTRILASGAAVAVLLTLLLVAASRAWIVRPLGALVHATRELELGRRTPIEHDANDEIGDLAHAFARMADTITERERAIAQRNADLQRVLGNVAQGFLVLDREARVGAERSAVVDSWFGPVAPGTRWSEVIARVDASRGESFELQWEMLQEGAMPLELCLAQLPSRLAIGERHFRIEYRPVAAEGADEESPDAVVVIVSDVTDEVRRAVAEAEQRDVLHAVPRLLADREGYLMFVREARAIVARIESGDAQNVARDVHTLKGICAMHRVDRVAATCEAVETAASERHANGPDPIERAAIVSAWRAFDESVRVLADDAQRGGGIDVADEDLAELMQAIRERAPHSRLGAIVEQWSEERVGIVLARLGEQARRLALRLRKAEPEIVVEAQGVRASRETLEPIAAELVHVVRNAIDHGIESAGERAAAGKPERARLVLSARREGSSIVFSIADDGRGVDWDKVRERAREKGMAVQTRDDLVAAIFSDGLSTRDEASEISGRGVGLAALRAGVEQRGGRLELHSERGHGTRIEVWVPAVRRSSALESDRRALVG